MNSTSKTAEQALGISSTEWKMVLLGLKISLLKTDLHLGETAFVGSKSVINKVYDKNGNLNSVSKLMKVGAPGPEVRDIEYDAAVSLGKEIKADTVDGTPHIKSNGIRHFHTLFSTYAYILIEPLYAVSSDKNFLLRDFMETYGEGVTAIWIGLNILKALKNCNDTFPGFVHRDLRLRNIFLLLSDMTMDRTFVLLGDFGIASLSDTTFTHEAVSKDSYVRRHDEFEAPEPKLNHVSSDIYSLGKVLISLLGNSSDCRGLRAFLEQMTQVKPENRPTVEECLSFFTRQYNLFASCIRKECAAERDCLDALRKNNAERAALILPKINSPIKKRRYCGILNSLQGRFADAENFFREGSKTDPFCAYYLASLFCNMGRTAEAAEILTGIVYTLSPVHPVYDPAKVLLSALRPTTFNLSATDRLVKERILSGKNRLVY